jgi:hypothetical protein
MEAKCPTGSGRSHDERAARRSLGRADDGRVAAIGAAEHARAPRRGEGLSRNLAYHRRARLEGRIVEALEEVDRQIGELRAAKS